MVGLEQRDADFAQDLEQAALNALAVVAKRCLIRHRTAERARLAACNTLGRIEPVEHALVGEVGVHSRRAVADEAGEVVRRPGLSRLHDNRGAQAQRLVEQVVVHRAHGQKRRDEELARARGAAKGGVGLVGENERVRTLLNRSNGLCAQCLDGRRETAGQIDRVAGGQALRAELGRGLEHGQLGVVEQRCLELELRGGAARGSGLGQVLRSAEEHVVLLAHDHVE
mmetsp:Transcript_26961/g.68276  ORF Transcript_26961/g.68276 Transcript_26961/m.68276 type:complete len:226 (+) Transcript_26961:835-1512(+)